MLGLHQRQRLPEIMDQADLDPEEHRRALAGLGRINAVSFSGALVAKPLIELAKSLGKTELSVGDIACGGGDVAIKMAQHAAKHGIRLSVTGIDMSEVALEQAATNAANAKIEMRFVNQDICQTELSESYDVVTSSLFMHHLDPPQVIDVLNKMRSASRHMVVINDLCRSTAGWLVAQLVCRLLSRSYVVHVDGPRSVRGAFTESEFMELCHHAGLQSSRIRRRWPFRFIMVNQHG